MVLRGARLGGLIRRVGRGVAGGCGVWLASAAAGSWVAAGVDFEREIRPILVSSCVPCHGPEKQKGGLRLDRRAEALKGGEDGPAILPGRGAESLLIRLVSGEEPERVMPAKGERLDPAAVARLRTWIDEGAPWPGEEAAPADEPTWWSLKPLERPAVPAVPAGSWRVANPVDAFLVARLASEGLVQAPEADRWTLIRRLTFDLTGLPPSPEEVAAFVGDGAPGSYERLVERLLASPRYGERWARHWMDVARYAETHGHDQDRVREHAWPYRDYLVRAFNGDRPYARFVEEQVAGDVVYPDDPEGVVALGFLAAGPWDESSLRDIREDTLDRQVGRYLDRDDVVTTVMQTFASTTVQCARCHDHKFDPVTQEDYYGLQAVFAGVDKANRRYDADPGVARRRRQLMAGLSAVERGERGVLLGASAERRVAAWEREAGGRVTWEVFRPDVFVSAGGAELTRQADGSLLAGGVHASKDSYVISGPVPLRRVTAVRLEVLTDASLPQQGPGREPNGNLHLSEFRLSWFEPGGVAGRRVVLTNATADFSQAGWGVGAALDGDEKTAWGIHPEVGKPHEAVFELAEPLVVPAGSRFSFVLMQQHGGHCLGRFRISVADVGRPGTAAVLPREVRAALETPAAVRGESERLVLAAHVVGGDLRRELAALPPPRLVYAAASDFEPDGGHKPSGGPRPVHVLRRGDVRQPLAVVGPGALACVTWLPARFGESTGDDEGARRAALARWLTDRRNPLTWRSIVNRVWQAHFGRGLVETPSDFGRMGAVPSHPELLDWLAVWFRDEAGGSLKALHAMLVTSETYRQAAMPGAGEARERALRVDAGNRWLGRMSRGRLDAESVRDAILAVSGRLDLRMGGPGDREFDLRPGIHVTPRVDYAAFDPEGSVVQRRSVYRFLFRTLPDPWMDALDCPAGDQATPVRTSGVTVQQALTLWNSEWVARQSERFAERLRAEGSRLEEQVAAGVRWVYGREGSAEELGELTGYASRHGLANLCRVLFNSNAFLFVE